MDKQAGAPCGPKGALSSQSQCSSSTMTFSSGHPCPPSPCRFSERVLPPCGRPLSHPRSPWLAGCLLSLVPLSTPTCSQAPKTWFSTSVVSRPLQDGLILLHGCNHQLPGQEHPLASTSHPHCLPTAAVPCQTITSCHPQPGPCSLLLLGFPCNHSPSFTYGFVLSSSFCFCPHTRSPAGSTLRMHGVLGLHWPFTPNSKPGQTGVPQPGPQVQLVSALFPAWHPEFPAGPACQPYVMSHSKLEPWYLPSSCEVPVHQGWGRSLSHSHLETLGPFQVPLKMRNSRY